MLESAIMSTKRPIESASRPAFSEQLAGGPAPLYAQIAQMFREQITSGQLAPQARMPTEEQLCDTYGVSRSTVRQAMAELLQRQMVVRRRGLGTFVVERSKAQRVTHPVGSLFHAVNYIGNVRYANLSRTEAVPPAEISERLGLEPGEKCLTIAEVGSSEGLPLTHAQMYFPLRFGRKLRARDFASGTTIVQLIEQHFGLRAQRAEQIVDPVAADRVTAELLGVASKTPLLRITRVYYLADGSAFGASVIQYHPQRYRLQIDLVERPPG